MRLLLSEYRLARLIVDSFPSPRTASKGALVALGRLRERLSAVRNLEHLVGSRTVGSQILAQVIPEVNVALSEWRETTLELAEHVGEILRAPQSELRSLLSLESHAVEALSCTLASTGKGLVAAKARLNVERELRQHIPAIVRAVAHWELLVEATRTNVMPMSVAELLSPTSERGSSFPCRPISVFGAADDLEVALPPRAGAHCLGALASAHHGPSKALFLDVQAVAGGVLLTFGERPPSAASGRAAELPLFSPSPITLEVVRSALRPFSGEIGEERGSLRLPRHVRS